MKSNKLLPLFLGLVMSLTGCTDVNKHANVGLLYCSSEANSVYQVNVVKKELEAKGLTTKKISFTNSTDLSSVLTSRIKTIDTLYVPTDNVCASNASIINNIARKNKTPVFAGEEGICEGCGEITLSISYYNIGIKTGQMAIDVLLGKQDIKTMPIGYDENPVKKYNKALCEELGITVPEDYVELGQDGGSSEYHIDFENVNNQKFNIGVLQLVAHEALDAATRGFMDAVKAGLGEENVTFDVQNAAGQIPLCSTIANNFVSRKVDLIMANATPALQSCASATKTIPVLGTSVTEYGVALGIKDFDGVVGTNVSGTSDLAPLAEQAAMLAEVFKDFMK